MLLKKSSKKCKELCSFLNKVVKMVIFVIFSNNSALLLGLPLKFIWLSEHAQMNWDMNMRVEGLNPGSCFKKTKNDIHCHFANS